jgi:undecaprenyl-diphosphatase
LNWEIDPEAAFIFDVLVQLGTLVAVIVYFKDDLVRLTSAAYRGIAAKSPFAHPDARLAWLLVFATIPAALAGVLLKQTVEETFNLPPAAAGFLIFTGIVLIAAERFSKTAVSLQMSDITPGKAVWVGAAQILSLFPGISRSGMTISAGLTAGLTRVSAARFSFLMAIPIMLGAGLIALLDLAEMQDTLSQIPTIVGGFASAAVVGYFSIRWLLVFLGRGRLSLFAGYCLVAGVISILLWFARS